jgi:hypothetical protein
MTLRLSQALSVVCYLLVAYGMYYMGLPSIGVALHRNDSPVLFSAGIFVFFFAVLFFLLTRSWTAAHLENRPIITGVLWALAAVFGFMAVRLLYFGIRSYL